MGKSIKKAYRGLVVGLDILLLLYYLFIFAFQIPAFQTYTAQVATRYLSSELGSTIELKSLEITFFNRVVAEDIYVEDREGDTLMYSKELDLGFSVRDLLSFKMKVQSICMTEPMISLRKYEGREEINLKFLIDYFSGKDSLTAELNYGIEHFEIVKGTFRYRDGNFPHSELSGFDKYHVFVRDLNLYTNDLNIDTNHIRTPYLKVSFREKDFQVDHLTAGVSVSDQKISLRELHLQSPNTEIHSSLNIRTENWSSYRNFFTDVTFQADFLPSHLGMKDLSYFIPDLVGMNDIPVVSGSFTGSLANLKGRDVNVSLADHSHAKLNFRFKGLPDFMNTYLYLDVKELSSSKNGLEKIKIPPFQENNHIELPSNFAHLGEMKFTGKVTGFPTDLVVNGKLLTRIGNVNMDLAMKSGKIFSYSGDISAVNFDAGKFFEVSDVLENVSLIAKIKGEGLQKDDINASIEGKIQHMRFKQYDYKNMGISGHFEKETFEGSFNVNDQYVKLDFNGIMDLSSRRKRFIFNSNIRDIYPRIVLGMNHVDSTAHLSSKLSMDMEYTSIDSLFGNINLIDIKYRDKKDSLDLEKFHFSSKRDGGIKHHSVRSDILDFNLDGKFYMLDGYKSFKKIARKYFPNLIEEEVEVDKDFSFNVTIKDYRLLEKLITPEMSVDSGSSMAGRFNSGLEEVDVQCFILGFREKNLKIDTTQIHLYTKEDMLKLDGRVSHYSLGRKTQKRFIEIHSEAKNSMIESNLTSYGSGPFSSEIHLFNRLSGRNSISFRFEEASFHIDDLLWQINDSNFVLYDSSRWTFQHLGVHHQNQQIKLDGVLSKRPEDKVKLTLDSFNLDQLNPFIEDLKLSLQGNINGEASVRDPFNQLLFESNLTFEKLIFNDKKVGSGNLNSVWDHETKRLNVEGNLMHQREQRFGIKGYYAIEDQTSPLNFELMMKDMPLVTLEPLTRDVLSEIQGSATGSFEIRGSLREPDMSGSFFLQNAAANVDYTNVRYEFKNKVLFGDMISGSIDNEKISIPKFKVVDKSQNIGFASLNFIHNRFKTFRTELNVQMQNLLVMNTRKSKDRSFYGKVFASGDVSISSENGKSYIEMDVATEDKSVFSLLMDESSEIAENQFIVFEQREEKKEETEHQEEKNSLNLEMNMRLEAKPGALVRIVFDDIEEDVIEARGSGVLNMHYDPENNLSLNGEYVINTGNYVFKLQSIVNKRFIIEPGSSIKWNGDPYKGDMDVVTTYKTRARLIDILPEIYNDVNYRRKIPVHLRLKMTRNIEEPVIGFEVYLPESPETIRQQMRGQLSDETCLNQQVFSLLILTSFYPCEDAQNNTASTNAGMATAYEAMSNQLSNWLSNINENLDVGVTYTPEIQGEEYTPEQLEVAVSTQLFNDRVIVDGNVSNGNRTTPEQKSNERDIAGEASIEYLIRPDGKLSVKVFHKVNERAYIENDNLYIQGVGLKWSHDFGGGNDKAARRKDEDDDL